MPDQPQLMLAPLKGETICYTCSLCKQSFILPDDVPPRQGMSELWSAFQEHLSAAHCGNLVAANLTHRPAPADPNGSGTVM
jgi:hypothetical protein